METNILRTQIKDIYTLGSSLGLVERGSREDPLHTLVFSVTGKEGVSTLTQPEGKKVLSELLARMRTATVKPPAPKHQDTAKGMTEGQQRKVWQLMYELKALDVLPSKATLGERLCGIIKRELDVDATPQHPFAWLGYSNGNKLIECLKHYIYNTKQKHAIGVSANERPD